MSLETPLHMKTVMLYGELSECICSLYETDCYANVCSTTDVMGVILAGTNPFLHELFLHHPNRTNLILIDLFGHYDRLLDGGIKGAALMEALVSLSGFEITDLVGSPGLHKPEFYASDDVDAYEPIVIQPCAGSAERDLPIPVLRRIVRDCLAAGRDVHITTRSYVRWRLGRQIHSEEIIPSDVASLPGVFWHRTLSLPATLNLIKKCALFVGCHSSLLQAAWHEGRPVHALYPPDCKDWDGNRHDKIAASGAFFANTRHQLFSKFDASALRKQLLGLATCGRRSNIHVTSAEKGHSSTSPKAEGLYLRPDLQRRYRGSLGTDTVSLTLYPSELAYLEGHPDIRRWKVEGSKLRLYSSGGLEVAELEADRANLVGDFCGKTLKVTAAPLRRYLVHGLQRTCTNLIEHCFRTKLCAPRVTQFHKGKSYWKHGWLPVAEQLNDVFVVICVRHPLHWLTACFDYFCAEWGKDGTICPHFDPGDSFHGWLEKPHYNWPCPAERWNVMNNHWWHKVAELGSCGTIVRAEDCQTEWVQRVTLRRLLTQYDPLLPEYLLDGFVRQRLNNTNQQTVEAMDSTPYLHQTYLERYSIVSLQSTLRVLDAGLMKRLGYVTPEIQGPTP